MELKNKLHVFFRFFILLCTFCLTTVSSSAMYTPDGRFLFGGYGSEDETNTPNTRKKIQAHYTNSNINIYFFLNNYEYKMLYFVSCCFIYFVAAEYGECVLEQSNMPISMNLPSSSICNMNNCQNTGFLKAGSTTLPVGMN